MTEKKKKKAANKTAKKSTSKKTSKKKTAKKMTDKEWEKHFEKKCEDFGEEMEELGKRMEKKFSDGFGDPDRKHKGWNGCCHLSCDSDCGVGCFLFKAIFGLIVAILGASFLGWLGWSTGILFFSRFSSFIFIHLDILFAAGVFFSLIEHLYCKFPRTYNFLNVIETGAGATFGIWIAAKIIGIINEGIGNPGLNSIVGWVEPNLIWILVFFLFIGIAKYLDRTFTGKRCHDDGN